MTPNEYGTWLYGRDGWCNGRPVQPFVADVTDLVYGGSEIAEHGVSASVARGAPRTLRLEYSAVWCSAPGTCAPPDPGPPSTWAQAPPVMMVSVFLVFGEAPAAAPPWWRRTWLEATAAGVAGVVVGGAAMAGMLGARRRGCARRGATGRPSAPLASADVVAVGSE